MNVISAGILPASGVDKQNFYPENKKSNYYPPQTNNYRQLSLENSPYQLTYYCEESDFAEVDKQNFYPENKKSNYHPP
ncbi:hypothetical protein [Okeania sp. SIO1H4]|uniref:hypothetical protein n=1 Tax=Okeania sp. SIO1H4 TaxID=2607776 RepID=UPI0013C88807|nr:hypothetical protein [Okeania sp. SIO1H4]NES74638.1 hypothetical protein [Okeania sp. SIO1H4]